MNVCILYGGRSGEHEVSLRSAASVVANLDTGRHRLTAIGIGRDGSWHLQKRIVRRAIPGQGEALEILPSARTVSVVPAGGIHADGERLAIDCVFPVLHGTYGEDGTVQGLLDIAGLPYVGAGVLGSSVSLDKERSKRLWRDAGIPVVEFAVVSRSAETSAAAAVGFPACVKPVSAGSSLGVHRVDGAGGLEDALADALRYDTRALVERFVDAREIECSVVGNDAPRAFPPGEVVTTGSHAFYDYEAKYTDPEGARLEAPARLEPAVRDLVMRTAEAAYAAVGCEGMARVDFFLERGTGRLFVNEINTIPGFTSISMFPRMCAAGGLAYPELLDLLLGLAVERHRRRATVRFEK
ncbi:MAG: D-alanine--D-alanine ligase [Spirochaetes bacterium]|nr:D-alanine--D-alanine ligase [Spirochaetota bacterium]